MREIIVAPVLELRARLSHRFEEWVAESLDHKVASERFSCGLTGGSSAMIFLPALREAHVDWSRVTLYWGDERAVPADSPDSNFALADQMLCKPLGASAPQTVPMPADTSDLASAAKQYAQRIPASLDLLILGVGDDGHVCSLFPGHRVLQVTNASVAHIEDAPKAPSRRLTLTMSYVLKSQAIWIVAVGERKRLLLQRAVSGDPASLPVDLVIAQGRNVTILTDQQIYRR